MFKRKDISKTIKIYSQNGILFIQAYTTFYYTMAIAKCDLELDVYVGYTNIAPLLGTIDTVTEMMITDNSLVFQNDMVDISLDYVYEDVDVFMPEVTTMNWELNHDHYSTIGALKSLQSLSNYKTQFMAYNSVAISPKGFFTLYPTTHFIDEAASVGVSTLLDSFETNALAAFTKAGTNYGDNGTNIVFFNENPLEWLTVSKRPMSGYTIPTDVELISTVSAREAILQLRLFERIDKFGYVTMSGNVLSMEVPGSIMQCKLRDVEVTSREALKVPAAYFTNIMSFLGGKVSVYKCQSKSLMLLVSGKRKCLTTLIN